MFNRKNCQAKHREEISDDTAIKDINACLVRKVKPEIVQTQLGYMKNKFTTQEICKQCPPIQEEIKEDVRVLRAG